MTLWANTAREKRHRHHTFVHIQRTSAQSHTCKFIHKLRCPPVHAHTGTNATGKKNPNTIRFPVDDTCQYSFCLKDAVDVDWWVVAHTSVHMHTDHTGFITGFNFYCRKYSILLTFLFPRPSLCFTFFFHSALVHEGVCLLFHRAFISLWLTSLLHLITVVYETEDISPVCNELAELLMQKHVTVKHCQFYLQYQARKRLLI